MHKIWLVIQREYITRVRNKTFLLSTFLLPLTMVLFIGGSVFFAVNGRETLKVAIANDPGIFEKSITIDTSQLKLSFTQQVDSSNFQQKGFDAVLYIPTDTMDSNYKIYSRKQLGIESTGTLKHQLNSALEAHWLQEQGIERSFLDSINQKSKNAVSISNIVQDKEGKTKTANAGLAYGIGFGSGILIYITMFIFGAMVMRGVMEEKMNRIAEVIVSSIKPFQLMMGKIIGIAAVGLTQFILWIGLILLISTAATQFLSPESLQQAQQVNTGMGGSYAEKQAMAMKIVELKSKVESVNWPLIVGCFLFYFLGGYLFYASLFAAVGSAVNEDPQEAQSLMLPITMPIIFAFIMLSSGLQNTNSSMMIWGSMIPFTSPIIMMGRIPTGVPWEQLVLSMVLLIAGFIFTTWLAGKIYRTGILMYGKKASWKEMLKWAFRK